MRCVVVSSPVVLDQNTHGGRQVRRPLVQVGLDRAVEVGDPTQFELLADLGRQVGDRPARRLPPIRPNLSRLERVDVGGLGRQRRGDDLVGQFLELGVLGDEVGLAS